MENFKIGELVRHKMTGEKLMILACDEGSLLGDQEVRVVYTVRLPDYSRVKDIQSFELEALMPTDRRG